MERFYLAALLAVPKLKQNTVRRLLGSMKSAEAVWKAPMKELATFMTENEQTALMNFRNKKAGLPEKIANDVETRGIKVYTEESSEYPSILKEIAQPPMILFCRGTLVPDVQRIAMVGSRKATAYGRHAAEELSAELAASGLTVVSGAARGIDTFSHKGAMKTGRTVAVLGCGIDVTYPPENEELLCEIAENGAVISEYPPGTPPNQGFFPARNRIISGLSMGTVVVEAAEHSGSLITAEMALSEGRDVFAVPGSIYSPMSAGANRLIQQGAKLVRSGRDVLSEYPAFSAAPEGKTSYAEEGLPQGLSPDEKKIYELLSHDEARTADEIIYALHGSGAANVAFLLLQMELRGLVEEDENHAYTRRIKEA